MKCVWDDNLLNHLAAEVSDREVEDALRSIPPHYAAGLLVDPANTLGFDVSLTLGSGVNQVVGQLTDFNNEDTYCGVWVAGGVAGGSGPIQIQIQDSPDTTSGNFTDPTSGLAAFPVNVVSGGNFWANSGLWASGGNGDNLPPVDQAPAFCSGGIWFGSFQRKNRFCRLINVSGAYPGAITAGFLSNKRTTGSGGGFSLLPGSGPVSV